MTRRTWESVRVDIALVASCLTLAVHAFAQPAVAQELPWLDLTVRAPSTCPLGSEIEREITRLVGDAPRDKGRLKATIDITGSDDRTWRARVQSEYGGEGGERVLEGGTCRAVARAAALVVALTVDSHAGAIDEPPPPPKPPEILLPPSPPPPAPVSKRQRWFVLFGARTEAGLLPHLGAGVGVGAGLRFPLGSFEVAGATYLPERTTLPGTAAGGRFSLLSVGGRACPQIIGAAVDLFACVGVQWDRLHAEGFGVTAPGSAVANLTTFTLGPRVDFLPRRKVRASFGIDANYTPGHASFALDNLGRVRTAAQIGASARLDVVWNF